MSKSDTVIFVLSTLYTDGEVFAEVASEMNDIASELLIEKLLKLQIHLFLQERSMQKNFSIDTKNHSPSNIMKFLKWHSTIDFI